MQKIYPNQSCDASYAKSLKIELLYQNFNKFKIKYIDKP